MAKLSLANVSTAPSFAEVYRDLEAKRRPRGSKPDFVETLSGAYEEIQSWLKLEDDPAYRTFGDCMAALQVHLSAPEWLDAMSGKFDRLVDLGVGSGRKLAEILAHGRHLGLSEAIIVDHSKGMLEHAFNVLNAGEGFDRLPIYPVRLDFVKKLPKLKKSRTHGDQSEEGSNTIFFLLGCTFGNYTETIIANGLRKALVPGDAIVIGVELRSLRHGHTRTPEEASAQYRNPSLGDFVEASAKQNLGGGRNYRDVMNVGVVEGGNNSAIPSTWSILTTIEVDGVQRVMVQSNRYDETEFVRFIEGFGFSQRYAIASPRNPFYKHFFFQRTS